jgi:hypothetical protein
MVVQAATSFERLLSEAVSFLRSVFFISSFRGPKAQFLHRIVWRESLATWKHVENAGLQPRITNGLTAAMFVTILCTDCISSKTLTKTYCLCSSSLTFTLISKIVPILSRNNVLSSSDLMARLYICPVYVCLIDCNSSISVLSSRNRVSAHVVFLIQHIRAQSFPCTSYLAPFRSYFSYCLLICNYFL